MPASVDSKTTYVNSKSFRCNTYKKPGGRGPVNWIVVSTFNLQPSTFDFQRSDLPLKG